MANLKDLIVQGVSRFIGNVYGSKFITDGGTSSQFVKGDGTLDSTAYGTYSKPNGGIPKTDLTSDVQTSLGKADTVYVENSTDNAIPKFDGTDGALQNSGVTIDDNNNLITPELTVSKMLHPNTGTATAAVTSSPYKGVLWTFNLGMDTLTTGDTIIIKAPSAGHSYGVFISVDNGAHYKPISVTTTSRLTTHYGANYVLMLYYDASGSTASMYGQIGNDGQVTGTASTVTNSGGCWRVSGYYDSNSDSNGIYLRTNNSTLAMTDAMYRYRLYFTSADGTKWVPSTTSTSTNATSARTVNQRPINPFGPILLYNSTGNFAQNATGPVTTGYQQYPFTLGYAFNRTGAALTLTVNAPVYIKCTPQPDGSAIIDADTPYTQSLPSTEDGFIYIYIGIAYSATQVDFRIEHPVYYYKDAGIKVWDGNIESFYKKVTDYSKEYLTIVSLENNNVITWKANNGNTPSRSIKWSRDLISWTTVACSTSGATLTTLSIGEKIYIKGNNSSYASDSSKFVYFTTSGKFNLEGNIMSLVYEDNFASHDTFSDLTYIFYGLFKNSNLVSAQNLILPAMILKESCYSNMFNGCMLLTTAPELPATTLAPGCYDSMFYNCRLLKTAPQLPATALAYACYYYMFYNCTLLTTTPELPATTLAQHCYHSMFNSCSSLVVAPKLPAMILKESCYSNMFASCVALKTAPKLPATTLAESCYENMFEGCPSLVIAPELPAMTLTYGCYNGMFRDCESLVEVPELPATTLASYCYSSMFRGCIELSEAPELPSTKLVSNCYSSMFSSCQSLAVAPILPAKVLQNSCYENMFTGCTNLSYIEMLATDVSAENCLSGWVDNVSNSGMFIKAESMTQLSTGVNGIPTGWNVKNDPTIYFDGYNEDETPYIVIVNNNSNPDYVLPSIVSSVSLIYTSSDPTIVDVSSSQHSITFGNNRGEVTISAIFIGSSNYIAKTLTYTIKYVDYYDELSYNELYFSIIPLDGEHPVLEYQGNNQLQICEGDLNRHSFGAWSDYTGSIDFRGTLMIRLSTSYNNPFPESFGYLRITDGSVKICGNIMSLVYPRYFVNRKKNFFNEQFNFQSLFYRDTTIRDAKDLIIPEIPPTSYCYANMFYGCTNLINSPKLPAINLKRYCYSQMFYECTSLVQAPELPSQYAPVNCYFAMFTNCTSLVTAPELPAKVLGSDCYSHMFDGCTNLIIAPELPANELQSSCYSTMFYGCTNLRYVRILARTIMGSDALTYMLSGVNSNGTIVIREDSDIDFSSYIPSGWIVVYI